jgi:hypothetical protein
MFLIAVVKSCFVVCEAKDEPEDEPEDSTGKDKPHVSFDEVFPKDKSNAKTSEPLKPKHLMLARNPTIPSQAPRILTSPPRPAPLLHLRPRLLNLFARLVVSVRMARGVLVRMLTLNMLPRSRRRIWILS